MTVQRWAPQMKDNNWTEKKNSHKYTEVTQEEHSPEKDPGSYFGGDKS